MIKLNLLPPQEKEALKTEQTQRWIIFYGSWISFILLIFAALLSAVWFSLKIELDGASNNLLQIQTSLEGQNLAAQQKSIADLNSELKKIDGLQKNQKAYSEFLATLAKLIPEGITLNSFSINEKNEINLSGHAQKREQIIALKDSLEKSSLFENIESPLGNLIKQTDADFNFAFNIKPEFLKQFK